MGRLFLILLIIFGATYVYTNQDEILNKINQHTTLNSKIYKLKNLKDKQLHFYGENIYNH